MQLPSILMVLVIGLLVSYYAEASGAENEMAQEELAIEEADKLYNSHEFLPLHEHLTKFKDSSNADILWRLARAARDVGAMEYTSPDDKKQLTYKALDYSTRALSLDGSNYECHKWYAICLRDVGDYEGTKKKMTDAKVIKEHVEKAIELNPNDATSVYLLGLWCYTFADLAWYEMKIAAVVFGSPPSSSYSEALEYFLKAEELSPNFYSKNLLMIGKIYDKMGNEEMAVLYLRKLQKYDAVTNEDNENIKIAKDMLKGLGEES